MFLAWKRLTPFERVGIRDAGWLSSQSPLMPYKGRPCGLEA